jgi:hypothetical protein
MNCLDKIPISNNTKFQIQPEADPPLAENPNFKIPNKTAH